MTKHSYSLSTVLRIVLKLMDALENLHEIGYIHRDIKPENVCVDLEANDGDFYLVDLGLATPYLDEEGKHIPQK